MPEIEDVGNPTISQLWEETKQETEEDSSTDTNDTPNSDTPAASDDTSGETEDDGAASDDDQEDAAQSDENEGETEDENKNGENDGEEDGEEDGDEDEEESVADKVRKLLSDEAFLDSALKEAGVDKITDIPIVKELLGRERQSAEDRTRAEIAREAFESSAVSQRLEQGQKAVDDFIGELNKVAEAIEADADEIILPTAEEVREKFQAAANFAVEAYHNKTWADLSEMIYGLPEIQAASDEAKKELADAVGKSPQEWLGAHLEVARQTLWNIAQAEVADAANEVIEDQKRVLEAAHKVELEKLQEKSERALKKAVEEAKKTTRAEALAEFGQGKVPPKTPKHEQTDASAVEEDDIPAGASIGEIFRRERARLEKTGAV